MKLIPAAPTTLVTNTDNLWEPASFSGFLTELTRMQFLCALIDHYALCREHTRVAWRLDSTFARFVKAKFWALTPQIKSKMIIAILLNSTVFSISLFLCKFETLTGSLAELLHASEENGLDSWFEWMK